MEKKLTNLLELRKKMKSRKPNFVRQQYNKKKSLGKNGMLLRYAFKIKIGQKKVK